VDLIASDQVQLVINTPEAGTRADGTHIALPP